MTIISPIISTHACEELTLPTVCISCRASSNYALAVEQQQPRCKSSQGCPAAAGQTFLHAYLLCH